jgi:RNA polymerase sigma factor (sigma-70 family)
MIRSATQSDPRPTPTAAPRLRLAQSRDDAPSAPRTSRSTPPLPAGELRRLVAGAARGDQRCWEPLVQRLTPLVRGVARAHRLSPADVDDVTQATWCRLVANIATLRDPERLPAWLATTARRESLRTLGRARRQIPCGDDLPEPDPSGEGPESNVMRQERDAALWAAVGRLRGSDQALLHLLVGDESIGEERSYREIAEQLGMAVGSIGPTRGRALQRLRSAVGDPDVLGPLAA